MSRQKQDPAIVPSDPAAKKRGGRLVLIVPLCALLLAAIATAALHFCGVLERLPTQPSRLDASVPAQADPPDDAARSDDAEPVSPPDDDTPTTSVRCDTAEEATVAFLTALSRDEINAALDLFVSDEYAAYGDWLTFFRTYRFTMVENYYSENPVIGALSENIRRGTNSQLLLMAINSLLAGENEMAAFLSENPGAMMYSEDDAAIYTEYDALMRDFSFRDVRFVACAPYQIPDAERSHSLSEDRMAAYGYTDLAGYVYLVEYQDVYYVGGMMLYRFESGWKISSLLCYPTGQYTLTRLDELGGMSAREAVECLTEEYGDALGDVTLLR